MAKPSICIATPNLGEIATDNVVNLLSWFASGKYALKWYAPQHVKPWDRARNLCHKAFLESGMDYLFFLDEHTVPPVDVLDRLLADDKDIVSATAQILKTDGGKHVLIPMAMRWDNGAQGYRPHFGSGLEAVDVTTLAATLIKRKVMEAVPRPAFRFTYTDEFGTDGLSEDFYFCERAKAAGFEICNDYRILCSHKTIADTKMINTMLLEVNNG
jgi:hypothetical protein